MSWHHNLMGHPHFLGYLSCVGGPDMDLDLHSSIFITKFVLQTQPGGYSQSWQSVHRWGMFLRRSQGLRQDCSQGPWGSWFASWALSCHCGSCSPTLQRLKMLLCLRHTDIWQRTDFSAGCPHFILCLLWGQGYIFKTPSQCWTNFLLTRAYVVTVRI